MADRLTVGEFESDCLEVVKEWQSDTYYRMDDAEYKCVLYSMAAEEGGCAYFLLRADETSDHPDRYFRVSVEAVEVDAYGHPLEG